MWDWSMTGGARLRRLARRVSLVVVLIAVVILVGGQMGLFSGSRPGNLGVSAGRLAPCKPTPNCVSSQANAADAEHYIAPIAFSGDAPKAWDTLRRAVHSVPRMAVAREDPDYLYVEFTSRLMGFVDDCEFALDRSGVIHVRSASRLGRKDFGVNRARIEAVRARFQALQRG